MNRAKTFTSYQSQPLRETKSWAYFQISLAAILFVGALGTLVWLAINTGQNQDGGAAANLAQQGEPAPDFALPSISGDSVHLSDYAGQVVVINLWATWCPPCKAEMPMINAYYEAHRDAGLAVLAVNSEEDATTVRQFIQAHGYGFPVLLDLQSDVSALYQVRGLPTTVVIDRQGRVQYIQTGEITAKQLEAAVKPLL
ncbi:MAG: TlpA disulfide reductase family protein [Caldilineaceae bacterium]